MTNFTELRAASDGQNEHNDCSVIAAAIVCGVTYATAHRALEKLGRRPRGRTRPGITEQAVRELGKDTAVLFGWDWLHPDEKGHHQHKVPPPGSPLLKGRTMITIEKVLRKHYAGRKFLIGCHGHMAAFDGVALQDWTKGRRHRVNKIAEVI